jgi:ubiquinone/menaquinone biosynthesis C-methylase UbiE
MDLRIAPQNIEKYISPYVLYFLKEHVNDVNKNMKIMDLGSGKYRHSLFFKKIGFNSITAVDKFTFPNRPLDIDFIYHDLENLLPFGKDSFDIVIATFLFMFINNKKQLIHEIDRICKINGFLIVELNCKKKAFNKEELKFGSLVDPISLIQLLNDTGFKLIHKKQDGFIAKKMR